MAIDFSLIKSSLSAASRKSMGAAGVIGASGGFFADVLQPIAPFAFYLCIISLVGLIASLAAVVALKKSTLPAAVFFALTFAVTGLLTLMQGSEEEEERGVLATMMPALAGIQNSLGLIQKDVSEIKETTTRTEGKVDQVLEKIDDVSKSGGIIADPKSPEDFYHNAQVHVSDGDYMAARQAYLGYFKNDLNKLDPHWRFAKILKAQDGRVGARETYRDLTSGSASLIPKYIAVHFLVGDARREALKKFADEHPDFSPALYHLAQEYSEEILGRQSTSAKRKQLDYLKRFEAAHKEGKLLKFFVDQELASEWLKKAETQRTIIENALGDGLLEKPVQLVWSFNNSGSQANIAISDNVLEFFWKIKGKAGEMKSTGNMPMADAVTGKVMPRPAFFLPKTQGACQVLVSYRDMDGDLQGPFEFTFDPMASFIEDTIKTLELTKLSWVSLQGNPADTKNVLLYFTQLLTFRGAIQEIRYGLDKDVPDQKFDFPAWNKAMSADLSGVTKFYVDVPNSTKFVTVQLLYKGGKKSEVMRYTAR